MLKQAFFVKALLPQIKEACEQLLPTVDFKRIHKLIDDGKIVVWIPEEEKTPADVLVLTYKLYDEIEDVTNLLIYLLVVKVEQSKSAWVDGIDDLKKYAQANDCKYVTFYTLNRSMMRLQSLIKSRACAYVVIPLEE